MDRKLIAEWDASYSRKGTIEIGDATCNVCGRDKVCLMIDSSEEEYGPGAICADCVSRAFQQAATP